MIIRTRAHARAGLIGNPSDGYFGKTIAFLMRNFTANVVCHESPRVAIRPLRRDQLEFESITALIDDVHRNGYYGGIRLIKAAIKCFHDHCQLHGIHLDNRNFTIEFETDIPVRVGMAGSSAIITATMRALMTFFGIDIPKPILPNLILSVELNELGIGAGLQDRVVQVYEGLVYMDFNKQIMDSHGYGHYENLSPASLPPLFVAYHEELAEGTEVTHNDLRSRFNRGDREVLDAMKQFAELTEQARELILAGRGGEIGPLMDANFDLREKVCEVSRANHELVQTGRRLGASVKFAGSGGAVVGVYDGDPERFSQIAKAYARLNAKVVTPQIAATN